MRCANQARWNHASRSWPSLAGHLTYRLLLGPRCLQATLASLLFLVTPLILLVIQRNPVCSPAHPEEARRAVSKARLRSR